MLYSKGLLDIASTPEVHMEGASNLIGLRPPPPPPREKMRELYSAPLEEKKRVLELVGPFPRTTGKPAKSGVHVGLAATHPSMGELSLIGVPVQLASGISAVIAVLGPMRMNYGRVMSAVQNVGQAFVDS